jgi:hypothetical protein
MTSVLRVVFFGVGYGLPEPSNITPGGFVVMLADGRKLLGEAIVRRQIPQLDAVNPHEKLKIKRQIRYRFEGPEAF